MFIKIFFKKSIFNDFKEIFLVPNLEITYYDNSHLNYIYTETKNDFEYTFYGFFKDDYFLIICKSYDKNLDINIEHKNIAIIKLKWISARMFNDKLIWIIDESQINDLNIECISLPIRNKFYLNQSINIDDYLNICDYKKTKVNIKIIDEIIIKKKNIFQSIIKYII
jgi:hypothetical protein